MKVFIISIVLVVLTGCEDREQAMNTLLEMCQGENKTLTIRLSQRRLSSNNFIQCEIYDLELKEAE